MKIPHASVLSLILFSLSAFGLGGMLGTASISYPMDIDANRKEKVQDLLKFMQDDLTFIEGVFLNQFSNQRFGGTSEQTSHFIALLHGVGLWQVDIQFRDFGEQKSAFTFDQDTSKDYVRLIINSGRNDFLLKDFAQFLPPPALPNSGKPVAEQDGAEQPATAPESKSEGSEKPKPESEGHSQ